ncbi:MAG: acylneuraminate cytidylyltransferase family protein [Bacteroidota bacterium]
MNILITICARGGSKGVPNKNIRPLNGIPLIGYSIKTAQKLVEVLPDINFDLQLSTDSDKIITTAAELGLATTYKRPDKLATDTAGKIGAIADVVHFAEKNKKVIYDFVLDLDATAPLRTVEDLVGAYHTILSNENALNLFSVSEAHRNPYFNMVEIDKNGFATLVKQPDSSVLSRQKAPKVYDMNASFYYYRRSFFTNGHQSAITDKSIAYLLKHICFDIDNLLDFELMEFLVGSNKLDFTLW